MRYYTFLVKQYVYTKVAQEILLVLHISLCTAYYKEGEKSKPIGQKPILEINSEHPLVGRIKAEHDDQRFAEWANLLFEQALLAEGGQLDDPASFVKRMNALLLVNS